jgi:D-3-phosphoglycerate dehydrogenase
MKYRVLISAPYFLPVVDEYRTFFEDHDIEPVLVNVVERLEEDDLISVLSDIDGVICGDDRFTDRAIAAAPRLKVISKWGTGIDSIDQLAAAKRNIRVCRTPDAFTEPVADTVIGYILCFARNLPFMDRNMKEHVWDKIPGHAMNEATLGVIGVGAIGRAVLKRARAFGSTLIGYDPNEPDDGFAEETGTEFTNLEDLLARSDYVSLNCDLNVTSRHLINSETLSRMKPNAVLINAARGPIIDEAALADALLSGSLAGAALDVTVSAVSKPPQWMFRLDGAALDVFENEPLPAGSPLREMDNVLLAPHNSNSSQTAWKAVHQSTLDQLVAGLKV